MKTQTIFVILLCVYILGYTAHALLLKKTVYGDGIFYYSYVRSAVVDGDIDFINEYKVFNTSQPRSPSGLPGNKYSIGASILWYPWFAWAHTLIRKTGYEPSYQYIIGFVSVLYAFVGLILLYRALREYFPEKVSICTICAVALCSNLLFYGSIDPVNSHAVSFFAVSLFISLILQKNQRWFQIGAALGLVALIRTQDVLIGVAAIALIKPKQLPLYIAGFFYVFVPQLLIWQILNNAFWKSQYISDIEGFRFFDTHILGVLFSKTNGLFLWTPITLLGFVGLWAKKKNPLFLTFAVVCVLQILVVSIWSVWWQGASYSGRMFVSSLPLLAFGIATIFQNIAKRKLLSCQMYRIFILPLFFINLSLIIYFLLLT